MIPHAHIIGKQVLDVEIDVGEDFFALQQEVSQVFQTRVGPALDVLFSRYAEADTVIRLDTLEVDVGRIDRAHLEEELTTRILEALEPILAAQIGEIAPARHASPQARPGARQPFDEADFMLPGGIEQRAGTGPALEGDDATERAIDGGRDRGGGVEGRAAGAHRLEDRAFSDHAFSDRAFSDRVREDYVREDRAHEDRVREQGAVEHRALEEEGVEGDAGAKPGLEESGVEGGLIKEDWVQEEAVESRTIDGHTIELWHYFLQNGHFPWWAPPLDPSDFEARVMQVLEARPAFLVQTRAVVQRAPVALHRLVLQFSDAFLDHLARVSRPALSPRLLHVAQGFSRWAASHPASGIEPRVFRQVFWQEALHGLFAGLPEAAAQAEQVVARRALQRLSRLLAVAYPDLMARIQATFQREEAEGGVAPALLVRRLVQALAPPAQADESAQKTAALSDTDQDSPVPALEKTWHPEHAADPEAQADVATRHRAPGDAAEAHREPADPEHLSFVDVDEWEAAKEPSRPDTSEAVADDAMEVLREPDESVPQPPGAPPEAEAERRPDRVALADRPPEDQQRSLDSGEHQREALPQAASEESRALSPAAGRSEAAAQTGHAAGDEAAQTTPARDEAERITEAAREDAAASKAPGLDEEAAQEAGAAQAAKDAAQVGAAQAAKDAAAVRGEAPVPEQRSRGEDRLFLEDGPAPQPVKEGAELYLRNAGLVMLHPYLTAHFEHLGLVQDKAFVDEEARHRAIYQLQYLAMGRTQALEYSLTLNKLLCGHPLEQPLARDIVLTEAAQAEAENLLRAVLRNWGVLKNTSPDGLREGFLQREGKLTRKPFSWLLQVEQKSFDILLGQLPWGISIVKLPWMPEMLHVEWA